MFCLPLYIVQQEEFLLQEEEQHPPQPQLRQSQRTRALVVHHGINKYADTAHYINSANLKSKNQQILERLSKVNSQSNHGGMLQINLLITVEQCMEADG